MDIAALSDGSWHRRSYSFLNKVVTIISMKNGELSDIEPMIRAFMAWLLKEPLQKNYPATSDDSKSTHVYISLQKKG